jgi:hypothetical protein
MKTFPKTAAWLFALGFAMTVAPVAQATAPGCEPICSDPSCYFDPNEKFGLGGVKLGMGKAEAEKAFVKFLGVPSSYINGSSDWPAYKQMREVAEKAAKMGMVGAEFKEERKFTYSFIDEKRMVMIQVKSGFDTKPEAPVVETITLDDVTLKNIRGLLLIQKAWSEKGLADKKRVQELEASIPKIEEQDPKERRAAFEKNLLEKYGCPTISKYGPWEWCEKLDKNRTVCSPGEIPKFIYASGTLKLMRSSKISNKAGNALK